MSVWATHEIQNGCTYEFRVGPLSVWCSVSAHTWRFGTSRHDDVDGPVSWIEGSEPPTDLKWKTWIPPEGTVSSIGIRPILPDRPVVIRPSEPMQVPVSGKFNCFVEVPLSVGIFLPKSPNQLLVNEPALILSNTWFGEPTMGDLSYALRSEFKQSVDDLAVNGHTIVCPLRIRNRAAEPLSIERLCLRVQYLSVYRGDRFLWSNESSVSYRGANEWSRLAHGRGAPAFDGANERLADPFETPKSRFSLRSFNFGAEQL
ncbi:MAG: hypothetical protein ACI9OU_001247 [Candidatus Promineifilaceae bacterium]